MTYRDPEYFHRVRDDPVLQKALARLGFTEVRVFEMRHNAGLWISRPEWRFPNPPPPGETVWEPGISNGGEGRNSGVSRSSTTPVSQAFRSVKLTVAGALLARKWNLPAEIASMIELHVQLHFSAGAIAPEPAMKALCVLHLADALVSEWRSQLAEIAFEAVGAGLAGTTGDSDATAEIERASREPDAAFFAALGFEPSLAALTTPAIERSQTGCNARKLAAARSPPRSDILLFEANAP